MKVLIILKYRETYGEEQVYGSGYSSGLYNSAVMVDKMLNLNNITSSVVQVVDNNSIDKVVNYNSPDIVVIEAFWVVPEKLKLLASMYPNIKWVVRCHSNIPFLAQEGIAIEWTSAYAAIRNVFVATNTKAALKDLRTVISEKYNTTYNGASKKIIYIPNYYVKEDAEHPEYVFKAFDTIDVGCFGAIRPLKNQLIQAVAAINYSVEHNKTLRFHINSGRIESGGLPVISNLRALFKNNHKSSLIEHEWMPHNKFLGVLSTMDVSLQVSFSETFNIVTADAVAMHVPVVVSSDISWVSSRYQANPLDSDDISEKMYLATRNKWWDRPYRGANLIGLARYNAKSSEAILATLGGI